MRTNVDVAGVMPLASGWLFTPNDATTTRQLQRKNFVNNSISFRFGSSEHDVFTVGGAVISGLDFELMNDDGTFDGINWFDARVTVDLTVGNTLIPMGYYYVAKHYETGNVIRVECYDELKLLDEYQLYELGFTDADWETGMTIASLLSTIASHVGLAVDGLNQYGSSIVVHSPGNDRLTLRACVAYLAQMVGQFATVDHGGQNSYLKFKWYDLSSPVSAGTTFSHDFRTSDVTIQGVNVSDATSEHVEVLPSGGGSNPIKIENNPFIDENNVSTVATAIYAALGGASGLTFRPGSANILASPAYEAGDVLSVNTGKEQGVVLIATNLTYKLQLQEAITSDADADATDLRVSNQDYIKQQAKESAQELIQTLPRAGESLLLNGWVDAYMSNYSSDSRLLIPVVSVPSYSSTTSGSYTYYTYKGLKIDKDGVISTVGISNTQATIIACAHRQRVYVPSPPDDIPSPGHGVSSVWFPVELVVGLFLDSPIGSSEHYYGLIGETNLTFSGRWVYYFGNIQHPAGWRIQLAPMGLELGGDYEFLSPVNLNDGKACFIRFKKIRSADDSTYGVYLREAFDRGKSIGWFVSRHIAW